MLLYEVRSSQKEIAHAYHGTSDVFLDQIKVHGLDPNPPDRAFSDALDTGLAGIASMDGIYLTDNLAAAKTHAAHTVSSFGGKPLVVVVQYVKKSEEVDEDDIYAWVTNQVTSITDDTGKRQFLSWEDAHKKDEWLDRVRSDDSSLKAQVEADYRRSFRVSRDADITPIWMMLRSISDVLEGDNFSAMDSLEWIKSLHRHRGVWNHVRELIGLLMTTTGRPQSAQSPFKTNTFRINRVIGYKGKTRIVTIIDGRKQSRYTAYGDRPKRYIT